MFAHTILSVAHDPFPTSRAATKLLARATIHLLRCSYASKLISFMFIWHMKVPQTGVPNLQPRLWRSDYNNVFLRSAVPPSILWLDNVSMQTTDFLGDNQNKQQTSKQQNKRKAYFCQTSGKRSPVYLLRFRSYRKLQGSFVFFFHLST